MEEGEHRTSFFIIMHRGKERKEEGGLENPPSVVSPFFASLGERVIDHGLNNLYPSQRMKTASSSSSDWGGEKKTFYVSYLFFPGRERQRWKRRRRRVPPTTLSDR